MLASPANPHNDPLIKDLYEKLPTMSNVEAGRLGLAMQRVIRGESLEDTDPIAAAAYLAFMAKADKSADDWTHRKLKFMEDSLSGANVPTEKEAVQLRQDLNQRYATIKEDVRLNQSAKLRYMQDHIKNGPFEEVYVEPQMILGRAGGMATTAVEGQIIGLCGVKLYLPPGRNPKVPTKFAERYRQILQSRKGSQARKAVLQGKGVDPTGGKDARDGWEQVADIMHEINSESGTSSGGGDAGDNWLAPDLYQRF